MIVDDHAVVRAGLHQLLDRSPDISVIAEAANGEEAVAAMAEHEPGLVLMDLSMPKMDGIQATAAVLRRWPATKIVALTSFSDRERVVAMIGAGAVGYLLKDSTREELLSALRSAMQGGFPLAPMAAAAFLRNQADRTSSEDLTGREREVLALLAQGLSNRRIGEALSIGQATVKAHLTHIYHALNVSDRTSAALRAHQLGLAPPLAEPDSH
jgi:DNA-binding NarL/FixJ family response regulator